MELGAGSLHTLMGPGKPLGASRDLAVLSCLGFHSTHPRISDRTLQQLRRRSPVCKRGSRRPCLDGQDSYSQSPGFPRPRCLFCAKHPNAAGGPFLRLFPQSPPTLGPALLPAGGASHRPCRSGGGSEGAGAAGGLPAGCAACGETQPPETRYPQNLSNCASQLGAPAPQCHRPDHFPVTCGQWVGWSAPAPLTYLQLRELA